MYWECVLTLWPGAYGLKWLKHLFHKHITFFNLDLPDEIPGQAIPAGLHVRMNFETGMREAKLADGDSKFKYWRDGDREGSYFYFTNCTCNLLRSQKNLKWYD